MFLPGVGAFDDAINASQQQGMLEAAARTSFLDRANPLAACLNCVGYVGAVRGSRNRFQFMRPPVWGFAKAASSAYGEQPGLKIPPDGWNPLEIVRTG